MCQLPQDGAPDQGARGDWRPEGATRREEAEKLVIAVTQRRTMGTRWSTSGLPPKAYENSNVAGLLLVTH